MDHLAVALLLGALSVAAELLAARVPSSDGIVGQSAGRSTSVWSRSGHLAVVLVANDENEVMLTLRYSLVAYPPSWLCVLHKFGGAEACDGQ